MKRDNILKEAGVLLIAVIMVLSTVAVTADTEDNISNRPTSFAEVGYSYIESDPSTYLLNFGPVIFDQQPVPNDVGANGPFSDAGPGFRVYENFWGLAEDIYDIHWWGLCGYGAGQPQPGTVFEISFCADNGGIPDYTNHIVDFTGSLGTEITFVGTGNYYWGYEGFYFEMDLPAPVSMASGWVSVYKTTVNAQTFGWIDALTGDGNAYQTTTGSLNYDLAFELTGVDNLPPNTPSTPTGPATGFVNTPYTYSSTTTDPEGENVAYWFDWDDTTNSGWTSFVPSGDPGSATKQWTSPGTYQVTAKAKDIGDRESGFSAPLTVVISSGPVLDIGTITGGLFRVSAPINNIGGDTATNVQWTIDLVGGAFIGGSSPGTEPSIAAAGSVTVQSGLIIGFGPTTVTVTATCDEGSSDTRSQSGFVLLIFIIVNPGGG